MFFYSSLDAKKKLFQVEKVGIIGTAINTSRDFEYHIEYLIIYNSKGEEMVNYSLNKAFDCKISELYKKIIFNTILEENSKYFEINFEQEKIIVYNNQIKILCVYRDNIPTSLIKLYIKFIQNTFFNFVGIKVFQDNFDSNWKYICKIYETFFIHYLTKKFFSVIVEISNFEDMHSKEQEKLKNIIILDNYSNDIVFNLRTLLKKKKKFNFKKKESIWFEIKEQSKRVKDYLCSKVELSSTYPRLKFLFRPLKIDQGLTQIAIFSTNKLSRQANKYFEFDVSDYNEKIPLNLMLENLSTFLFEYLSPLVTSSFSPVSSLFYFDNDMLITIDEGLYLKMSFENFLNFIKKKLRVILTAKMKEDNPVNYHNAYNIEVILKVTKSFLFNSLFFDKKKSVDFLSGISIEMNPINNDELFRNVSGIMKREGDSTPFMNPSDLEWNISDDEKGGYNKLPSKDECTPKTRYNIGKKDKIGLIKDIQFKLLNYDNNGIALNRKTSTFSNRVNHYRSSNDLGNERGSKGGSQVKTNSLCVRGFMIKEIFYNDNDDHEQQIVNAEKMVESPCNYINNEENNYNNGNVAQKKVSNNLFEYYGDKYLLSPSVNNNIINPPLSPHFCRHNLGENGD